VALVSDSDTSFPTSQDDPRLKDWYHTIDVGEGLASEGVYDHRPVVDLYGIPTSLEGKTALDVGTADGFWAFEMERRGASRVVGINIGRYGDYDWLPWIRDSLGPRADLSGHDRFELARDMRGSQVEHEVCNVYDLSPERLGTFDVVFCGSLLLHVQNPLKALTNIRSVTKEMAIIEVIVDSEIEENHPDKPWLAFGHREGEEEVLGEEAIYWRFSTRGLQRMMEYAGFGSTEPQKSFKMPPTDIASTVVVGYPGPVGKPSAQGVGATAGSN
jgi:tRNA (mo5U34)-methyltransferase